MRADLLARQLLVHKIENKMNSRLEGESSQYSADKTDKKSITTFPKKALLTASDIKDLPRDEIIARYSDVEKYLATLEEKSEGLAMSDYDEKLKLQQQESTRRENVLVMRLATKEQEMQELLAQIHELKQSQTPATSQLKSTLLDPSVNLLFEKMKTELGDTKEKLEQAQNDLSAWKFTPDSVTGKKLMAKCRMLIAENQDLGKQLSQGRIAQLEAELALQKKYNEELTCSQDELNDFVLQLDEEVEGMESTICALQQQLKETKQKYQNSLEEVDKLRSISEETRSSQHEFKRTYELADSDIAETDRKRAKSMVKVIENDVVSTEEGQEGVRTDENMEEEFRLIKRTTNNFSSKNQLSGNNISPSDEEVTVIDGEEPLDTDEPFGAINSETFYLKKEGSNGEVFDS